MIKPEHWGDDHHTTLYMIHTCFIKTLVQCELSNETGRTRYCVIGKDVIAFNTNL